jgi:hypothetical protein
MTQINEGGAQGHISIEIVRLRRISQSQPTAWEGQTTENTKAHIAYLHGVLSVSLWQPTPRHGVNWGIWQEVIRVKPLEMMAEIQLVQEFGERGRSAGMGLAARRQQVRLECENRVLAEIRSDVWPRNGRRGRIVHVRELWEWMEAREKHFAMLNRRGLTGGPIRMKVSALTDGAG